MPYAHITKYKAEQKIGLDGHKIREKFEIAPLWPLLGFPERDNPAWKKFEHRMADKSRPLTSILQTPNVEQNKSPDQNNHHERRSAAATKTVSFPTQHNLRVSCTGKLGIPK